MRPRPVGRAAAACAVLGLASVSGATAQSVRISGVTTFQYVEVRPLVVDSVSASEVVGEGLLRRSVDGYLVRCVGSSAFCRFSRSDVPTSTVPGAQDLTISVWGLGRGVRAYARLRGRAVLSGEEHLWPRTDDAYDLLVAYAELDRERLRVRAGRQWKVSGLGYYNYDGASVLARPWPALALEAYGGWSLARGLNEPRTGGALAALESLAPDARAHIIGAQATYRPLTGTAVSFLYQREVRDDRTGLYSEQVAWDATARRARLTLEASGEVDLARHVLNEATVRVGSTLGKRLVLGAVARRYRPFFELWTIWGAFDPVGFDEVGANAVWRLPDGRSTLEVRGSRRAYDETHTNTTFGPVRSTGWQVTVDATTSPGPDWLLQAGYVRNIGFGAAKSDGHLGVRRELGERAYLGGSLRAFQTIFEFRVNAGTVLGWGLDGGLELTDRARISGTMAIYRHLVGGQAPEVDWSQTRGSLRVEWTVGAEPKVSGGAR